MLKGVNCAKCQMKLHLFLLIQIEKLYCLDNLEKNITIKGERGSYFVHSFIEIAFSCCVNSTENKNKCLPEETITDYVNNIHFIWGSLDYDINTDLFGHPFEPKIFTELHEINEKLMTHYLLIKFKQVKFISDQGFFTKSLKHILIPYILTHFPSRLIIPGFTRIC